MSLGSRIKYFRKLRSLTQKDLGIKLGFSDRTAGVRIAQYETDSKVPRESVINQIAEVLHVSTNALTAPDMDSMDGIYHTLFLLEDLAGFRINKNSKELCINLDDGSNVYSELLAFFSEWHEMAKKYRNGEISREEYDQWRYLYQGGEN